ncbi:hypothetical protein QQS21_007916 [Conoideocrella luteorostrata]|uniref:Uncharacterized protein n=1 Tax=Conoideocrella luteorostrata TaxID=1105319 RepID=A0AAJ0FRM7_9HYPO|nr:hypothetical protein QQS21_007916 [Conoideocrella luteorostrata]
MFLLVILTLLFITGLASPLFPTSPGSRHALPEAAPRDALRYQPVLDYDMDSCYNVPAIDAQGNVNKGLGHSGTTVAKYCRDAEDLDDQNVYEHYFEKDIAVSYVDCCGHRHEWENIVVFVQDGQRNASFVSASTHQTYIRRNASEVRFQGSHPKIVYHKDGISTHCFRFAVEKDDNVENHKHVWVRGALVDWNGYPSTMLRDTMISAFDENRPKIDNELFGGALKNAVGNMIPDFDPYAEG